MRPVWLYSRTWTNEESRLEKKSPVFGPEIVPSTLLLSSHKQTADAIKRRCEGSGTPQLSIESFSVGFVTDINCEDQ